MKATVGESCGIPLDPSLEKGKKEEKNLKKWRQRFIRIQKTGTRLEQAQEEREVARIFLKKIRSYEQGKGKRVDLRVANIPKLREKWDKMYEWIIVLMGYIEEMVCWDVRAMRTDRMKIVIQEAARLEERRGTENLTVANQGSGEDYAKRVLDFLEGAREEKRRKQED